MSLRREFVAQAKKPGANISALCRSYGITRKTGYKWRTRADSDGGDQSRRPRRSPRQTTAVVEQTLLAARDAHPTWGARKLKRYLQDSGESGLPAISTITAILHRHGRISPAASEAAQPWQRFEHPEPNALWQMDFKGHFALTRGRCHPLTVLDDHSRFNLVLQACRGETFQDVQTPLIRGFQTYGMPAAISCDNGPPWGTMLRDDRLTKLGVWLILLGIRLIHARPRHPQTNGKDERFHRTLKNDLLLRRTFINLNDAQLAFDRFRDEYNLIRPHAALDMACPISRYLASDRRYPAKLPAVEYDSTLPVRKVDVTGKIDFLGHRYRVSKALYGYRVALRADSEHDGRYHILFCHQLVRYIDLHNPEQSD